MRVIDPRAGARVLPRSTSPLAARFRRLLPFVERRFSIHYALFRSLSGGLIESIHAGLMGTDRPIYISFFFPLVTSLCLHPPGSASRRVDFPSAKNACKAALLLLLIIMTRRNDADAGRDVLGGGGRGEEKEETSRYAGQQLSGHNAALRRE